MIFVAYALLVKDHEWQEFMGKQVHLPIMLYVRMVKQFEEDIPKELLANSERFQSPICLGKDGGGSSTP